MLLSLLIACSVQSPATHPPEAARPDILVVTLAGVRADAMSANGNPRPTTPQFDILARKGARFADVTAPGSWSWPSHASLFTGFPPWIHGAHSAASIEDGSPSGIELNLTPMRDDLPTLAGQLANGGYRTALVSADPLLSESLGLTRGFEESAFFIDDGQVVQAAIEQMQRPDDRPLFLFVNLMAAHAPYAVTHAPWAASLEEALSEDAAPEWVRPYLDREPTTINFYQNAPEKHQNGIASYRNGEFKIDETGRDLLRRLYDGNVNIADFTLSRIMTTWFHTHPESITAVTSPNGVLLGERQRLGQAATVYPEVLQVPLVLVGPQFEPGTVIHTPVQLHDLQPTLLSLGGLSPTTTHSEYGHSLLSTMSENTRPGPIVAAAWPRTPLSGQVEQGWRLYRAEDEAVIVDADDTVEFYDLNTDPTMTTNRAKDQPAQATQLAERARSAIPIEHTNKIVLSNLADEETRALRHRGHIH